MQAFQIVELVLKWSAHILHAGFGATSFAQLSIFPYKIVSAKAFKGIPMPVFSLIR
jgi:hypothetical protein